MENQILIKTGDVIEHVKYDGNAAELRAIIKESQGILAAHLPPDGYTESHTISELLGLLDGPRTRTARPSITRPTFGRVSRARRP